MSEEIVTEARLASGTPLANGEMFRQRIGAVEWLAFNRPKSLNAMTHTMEAAMTQVFREVNDDPDVRALVLTGLSGDKPAFMAGADMGDLEDVGSLEDALRTEALAEEMTALLEAVRVPTMGVLNGFCVGMGGLIAAACDVRLASANLRFGFPIARTVGNCLSSKNFARLSSLIGPARTKELVFSARLLTADEMMAAGALREIVPPDGDLLTRAQDIATAMAQLAPLTLWGTKETLRRMRDETPEAAAKNDLLMACYASEDYQTAINAFTNREKPVFKGR